MEAAAAPTGDIMEESCNILDIILCGAATLTRTRGQISHREAALAFDHYLLTGVLEHLEPQWLRPLPPAPSLREWAMEKLSHEALALSRSSVETSCEADSQSAKPTDHTRGYHTWRL
eukprot:8381090-Pyramimonas_sp.AAC.1